MIILSACIKGNFDPGKFEGSLNLNPRLAVPIGYSHPGIEKYLINEYVNNELRISNDDFLSLFYYASIVTGIMSDLLSLQQISVNKKLLNQTRFMFIWPFSALMLSLCLGFNLLFGCNMKEIMHLPRKSSKEGLCPAYW